MPQTHPISVSQVLKHILSVHSLFDPPRPSFLFFRRRNLGALFCRDMERQFPHPESQLLPGPSSIRPSSQWRAPSKPLHPPTTPFSPLILYNFHSSTLIPLSSHPLTPHPFFPPTAHHLGASFIHNMQ